MITKEELNRYIEAYSKGQPLISDEEYDRLLEEYVSANGEESRPFTRVKQSTAINDIVGSLGKCYGIETPMREGQMTYVDWKRKKNIPDDALIIVQPKLDGGSVACDLNTMRYATRGDYDNGESEDVTALFSYNDHVGENIRSLFKQLKPVSMKFECIMSRQKFENAGLDELGDKKRPRDAMAAIIHSRNADFAREYLSLMPLRILGADGKMYVYMNLLDLECAELEAADYSGIQGYIDNLLANGAKTVSDHIPNYECDGVVVSWVDRKDRHIIDEVAIKILHMVEETKLLNIEYQMGTSGRITPVAILEPVKFGEVTVDHATLSNLNRVKEMGLRYNDTVRIMYNIVPYFLETLHGGTEEIPLIDKCPSCGTPFDMRFLKTIECTNPNCTARKLGNVIRYVKNMKMMGVAENTINDLWDAGLIRDIRDLYKITREQITTVDGYKEKSADNIIKAIDKASTNVPLERWLGSLPITGVATKTWKALIGFTYGDFSGTDCISRFINRVKELESPEDMLAELRVPVGIGEITLSKIAEGLRLHWNVLKDLIMNNCIKFVIPKPRKPLNGIKVGMSGTRDADVAKYLEDRGYEVIDYNDKCAMLVIPYEGYTSSKVERAKEKGKTIVTVEEVYTKLK